jgi:hypothetical protein
VVANDGALLRRRTTTGAVIANLTVAVAVDVATTAPATLDPDVAATATFPTSLLPDVTAALALVVAVAPNPLTTILGPTAFDPDVPGAGVDDDDARRRRLLLDLDVRNGGAHVTMSTNDASGAKRQ